MKNNSKFDIKNFIFPDVSHSPVYVWVWNDICSYKVIDEQLDEMHNLGIRAFYILPEPKNFRPNSMPTNLTPDYLSPEFFELCAYAINKGKELGMLCWIYDEGGWPSGGACGKVLEDHPEYAREELKKYKRSFSAGDIYIKSTPDVLVAFVQNNEIIEEGYIFTADNSVTEYVTEKLIGGNADYPDLLNKAATEYFIEITHEKYASSMNKSLGESVTAVFTDEPKAPSKAFSKELIHKYESLYGESVLPYLPLIAEKTEPTDKNVHILHRWYDLCSKMFCDNFLLPCKNWANEHGLAFTGHMDKDHDPLGCVRGGGNFNLMRALRCFDIPGVDVIHRQIYPENRLTDRNEMNGCNGFFPRYASSAATQNGTKLAMSEVFGVAGAAVTYDIMRYTVGYQVVRGINIFNLFNFPLGRKDVYLAQELPVFTENQPYYRYLNQFNRYTERLCYISSLGERICETGLYYPVCDFQGRLNADAAAKAFDTLGRTLEDLTVDFDIVDDDVIQKSNGAESGYISIGNAVYRNIIIPEGVFVPQETRKVLNRFIKGGGRVLSSLSQLTPVIQVEGSGLRAMHRRAENGELFLLFRECGDNGEYIVHLPSSEGYLLDLMSGKPEHFKTENGIMKLSLAMGEMAVIFLTDESIEAESKKEFVNKFDLPNESFFSRNIELVCTEKGFENIIYSDEAVSVNTGDWSSLIGSSYSGSCGYETSFTLPAEKAGKEALIDLGDVRYAAEIFVNGKAVGTALMPPYKVKIPAGVLEETNSLKIIVINTSANWYHHTDYFDKYSIKELSPYFEDEFIYAKDFVSGGLYGPLTLFTE